ncbi:MAG: HAD family hydrolase, partial [Nevskiaceae bacterium]
MALGLGHGSDAAVIVAVVLLNALIGAIQEGRAARALAALRKLAGRQARVLRGGVEQRVAAQELVPGDILVLDAGDAIAADARLLDGAAIQIAEAALTGESLPVAKHLLPLAPDTPLADRRNMVYAGTHVTAGRARAVVVATGGATEIGHIAALAETAVQPKTPLEQRIDQFGRALIGVAALLFLVINLIGYWRGLPYDQILMVAISQVVGMIPEGLPVAMTIALAVGVQRMARRQVVVRRLAAVESLGSTTVICSDKTGTLTRNEMTVTAILLADGRALTVSGAGYAPEGAFSNGEGLLDPAAHADLQRLLEAGLLCNDANLQGPADGETRWLPVGDPTEVALVTLAIKGGLVPAELRRQRPRRAEIPFDAAVQMMATQHQTPSGSQVLLKGAPEVLLALCASIQCEGQEIALDAAHGQALLDAAQSLAARGLRLLAFGVVEGGEIEGGRGYGAFAGRVRLLGLTGQTDPPRPEVKEAVALCRAAGIRPVMVTGDHRATALAVAQELGIARPSDAVIEGRELEQWSEAELAERIDGVAVFARVHPAQKLRIVGAYQRRQEVVAMTGDGVNDAPALVQADVGVAMGITGTEVAKEAAKIVISDDNFASIVAAVE